MDDHSERQREDSQKSEESAQPPEFEETTRAAPKNGESSSSAATVIDTPLQKALDAAAALALVGPKPEELVPPKLALDSVPNSLHARGAAFREIDDSPQQQQVLLVPLNHGAPALSASTHTSHKTGPSSEDIGSSTSATKKRAVASMSSRIHPSITPRPVVPVAPMPVLFPGSFEEVRAAMKSAQVPHIFRDRPLRSGKWNKEEEVYADILVELFNKGHVNERNGSTLRGFLSRMLHCTPMRISKKYAGKGIGKMSFLSKDGGYGFNGMLGPEVTNSLEYQQDMKRLKEAEEKFYRKCCSALFDHQGLQQGQALVPNYFPGGGVSIPSTHPSMMPPPSCPIPPGNLPPAALSSSIALPTIANHSSAITIGVKPAVWQQLPPPGFVWKHYSAPSGFSNTAIQQHTVPAVPIPPAPQMPTQMNPAVTSGNNAVKMHHNGYSHFLEQSYVGVAKAMHDQAIKPTLLHSISPVAPSSGPAVDDDNKSRRKLPHNHQQQPVVESSSVHSQQEASSGGLVDGNIELPDFLKGFDKARNEATQLGITIPVASAQAQEEDPCQFSPTYTSRSFDDFHRLLGSHLSPGGRHPAVPNNPTIPDPPVAKPPAAPLLQMPSRLDDERKERPHAPKIQPRHSHRDILQRAYNEAMSRNGNKSLPSDPADSYTVFAQQGAFAASQHSAYSSSKRDADGDGLSMLLMGIHQPTNHQESYTSSSTRTAASSSSQSTDEYDTTDRHSLPTPAIVSAEPSDQGSDEFNQGSGGDDSSPTTDSNSNDYSDESCSDSSRKRPRVAEPEEQWPASLKADMQWEMGS